MELEQAARHLGHVERDAVRVRGLPHQPARHAGPRGLLRGHLPHARRRRQRGDAARQPPGRRGAHAAAVRRLQAAAHADLHLRQQVRSRRRGSAQADQRRRGGSRISVSSDHVADPSRRRVRRRLRPAAEARSTCSSAARITARRAPRVAGGVALDDPELRELLGEKRTHACVHGHRAARRGRPLRSTRTRCSRASCRRCSSGARSPTSASSRSSREFLELAPAPLPRESTAGLDRADERGVHRASCSRSRRTWTRSTATASPSCASARGASRPACR